MPATVTSLAARVPDLDIFSQGLIERMNGGWRVTDEGRSVLEIMEARIGASSSESSANGTGEDRSAYPDERVDQQKR
ncbi:hypothetical protein ACTGJ9_012285 [Bradyrhizobium sp. RDM12]